MGNTKAAIVFGVGLGVLLSASGLYLDDWRFWLLCVGVNLLRSFCQPKATP